MDEVTLAEEFTRKMSILSMQAIRNEIKENLRAISRNMNYYKEKVREIDAHLTGTEKLMEGKNGFRN